MIALEQARQYMESLGLTEAVEVLDSRLDAAATKQMPYPDVKGVDAQRLCPLKCQGKMSSK